MDEVARRPGYDVQQQIKSIILRAGLAPGAPLPTETELMQRLNVSRGSLREALKGLQARGIVDVVHGRGMFVSPMSMGALVDGLSFHARLGTPDESRRLAAELVEVRDLLESALVQRVAIDPDPGTLARLDDLVTRMEDLAADAEPFHELDRAFHSELYADVDNRIVGQLIAAFWDVLEAARPALSASQDDRAANAQCHRAIVDAIRDRHPAEAGAAMTAHFAGTHRWIHAPDAPGRADTPLTA